MVRLDALLNSWKTVREDSALAVEEFPGNGLAGMLLSGEENLSGPEFREKVRKYFSSLPADCDGAALAAELRTSLAAPLAGLAEKTPEWYGHIVTRVDGAQVTRMEMLQFVKEHELTHRAQLFMYMRLKGIVPATTRRRLARQAGR